MDGVALRILAGVTGTPVNSWCRTPAHNAIVGGAEGSLHIVCRAIDVPLSSNKFASFCQAIGFKVIKESDHYHIQGTAATMILFTGLTLYGIYSLIQD